MEMTLLFILVKYSRYTSHFIGLVHINDLVVINTWWSRPMLICMLQVSRWRWYAKFASYSCCIEITLIGSIWISYLRISVDIAFWVLIVVHIYLAFVGFTNLQSFCKLLLYSRRELWATCLSIRSKHVLLQLPNL